MRDLRQHINETHGLYCYFAEDAPREWALWREADDTQLTPWIDLGPEGMIWVIWHEGDELVVVLEQRDDAAEPPVLRQALMHLPTGRRTEFAFAGDRSWETQLGVEPINMGNKALLMLTYPVDHEQSSEVRGAALYDKHLRELIGPCIAWVHPCGRQHEFVEVALRQADESVRYGVFDYVQARYLVPPEFAEVFEHDGRWIGNTPDARSVVHAANGEILATHDHTLHRGRADDVLYVQRAGLWGRADALGAITDAPQAPSLEALEAEAERFETLTLVAVPEHAYCLDEETLDALVDATGDEGMCIKYEGVEVEGWSGDGMLDVGWAELPEQVRAVLLDDRYGELRLLVLTQPWRALPPGSVLALAAKTQARAVAEDSDEAVFLQTVFAQSIEMD